ncbi:DUF2165 family protein [Congregibacter litoralis]|uniref:Putative small integral membrane protein n=1 Tax=Congregibacter litoralis KT71 TaxID=314285 RepID=A4A776_9GAMM|nr:DUF2165 family protein [Congregibacter litoralis]EAQ98145.1 putative small integral membrane protein [Congregibacter litoralis KT71]
MYRLVKVGLMATAAWWAISAALYNLSHWTESLSYVEAVTTMSLFEGGTDRWQATSNPIVIWAGLLFIFGGKVAAAIMCSMGTWRMWKAHDADPETFVEARQIGMAGCGIAVIMLFGGFIGIAENFFELWRSPDIGGSVLSGAYRYGGVMALIGILVGATDDY